jgi:hypothetical protein
MNKELIASLQPEGCFELDWQEIGDQIEKNQILIQEDFYQDYLENSMKALFNLGFSENSVELSQSLSYLRSISNAFVTALTRDPDIERKREATIIELDDADKEHLISSAPFMNGLENLNEKWINTVWERLNTVFSHEIKEYKFPIELAELFNAKGEGLFPSPKEIKLICSCPDWATMCKHVAATLYGVGARLDNDPSLFFVLRDISVNELISKTVIQKTEKLLDKSKKKSKRVIDTDDLSGLFGINVEKDGISL